MGVPGVVLVLEAPGVVRTLEELAVVWVQVTHRGGTRSSIPSRHSQGPRGRRPSARGPSTPAGCMLLILGLQSLRRAGIGQRVTMGVRTFDSGSLGRGLAWKSFQSQGCATDALELSTPRSAVARGHHCPSAPPNRRAPPWAWRVSACGLHLLAFCSWFLAELKEEEDQWGTTGRGQGI